MHKGKKRKSIQIEKTDIKLSFHLQFEKIPGKGKDPYWCAWGQVPSHSDEWDKLKEIMNHLHQWWGGRGARTASRRRL